MAVADLLDSTANEVDYNQPGVNPWVSRTIICTRPEDGADVDVVHAFPNSDTATHDQNIWTNEKGYTCSMCPCEPSVVVDGKIIEVWHQCHG